MFDTSYGLKTWILPGLSWGVYMYLVMTVVLPLIEGEPIEWDLAVSLPIWLIGGLVMQYFQFKRLNKKGRREIGQKTDSREYTGKAN